MNDPIEAVELDRIADWRIRQLGENPSDEVSVAAAALLQKLADELRQPRHPPAYTEYAAIVNWLGEFDVAEDFAERAHEYRLAIGVEHFPADAEAYLQALIAIAKETAGA